MAPLLILIGEKDDWTPALPCQKLAESSRTTVYPVAITVYPGAHHSFDSDRPVRYVAARVNRNAPGGRGATTGGDPGAWPTASSGSPGSSTAISADRLDRGRPGR